MRMLPTIGALATIAAVTPALADDFPGDPQAGRLYASKYCTECHGLGKAEGLSRGERSLQQIADDPSVTGTALVAWLTGISHPNMPNLILSPEDARDVVAYILSLKKPPGQSR